MIFVAMPLCTQVRKGQHYFEFVMHCIGDEQSCGIVADTFQTGDRFSVRHLKAWTYYAGRMGSDGGDTRDGRGADEKEDHKDKTSRVRRPSSEWGSSR